MRTRFTPFLTLVALTGGFVTGCDTMHIPSPDLGGFAEPEIVRSSTKAPPGAKPGTCWGKDVSPAIVETVTEQILVQPAEVLANGKVISHAIYRSEIRQAIIRERRETWFETPCQSAMDDVFIASLQRALKVRKHFRGTVTGIMDARTRAAIRRYQKSEGLDSGILTLEAARRLGLVAVPVE